MWDKLKTKKPYVEKNKSLLGIAHSWCDLQIKGFVLRGGDMNRNHHHAMSYIPMWVEIQDLKKILHSFVCGPCCLLYSEHSLLQAVVAHILLPLMRWNQTPAEFCIHSEKRGTLKCIISLVFHYSRPSIFIPENVYKLHVGIFYFVNVTSIKTNTSVQQNTTTPAKKYMQIENQMVTMLPTHCMNTRLNQG